MTPSVYINLEDDVAKVLARVKRERASQLVLVCPKRCQLFSDSINLRLLKKQTDFLGKTIFILTMDERGQLYATEAGFSLKFLPKGRQSSAVSDIQIKRKNQNMADKTQEGGLMKTVKNVTSFVTGLVGKKDGQEEDSLLSQTVFDYSGGAKSKIRQPQPKATAGAALKPKLRINEESFLRNRDEQSSGGKNKRKKFWTRSLTTILVLSLATILALVFIVLPEGQVLVYARSEPLTRDFDVSLDTSAGTFNASKLVLPAKKVEETIDIKSKFQSQGKKDVGNKATGNIKIYNFTGQVLNLRAGTTSILAGSKTYSLTSDALQIKPTKYKNEKTKEVDEASLNEPFEVVATAGGEDSNLPAGVRLEITNQIFGSRPQILYARTETPIIGGSSRFLSVVTDGDRSSAQAELANQGLQQTQKKLSLEDLHLAENSYRLEVLEFVADKQAGAESPSFEASLKVKIIGLAFSDQKLKNLVIERVGQTFPEGRYLKTQSEFNLDYKVRSVDLNIPAGVLGVHFEGKAISELKIGDLPKRLVGKSRQEASEVLQSMSEVEKAEITLSPSWQTNFPWFSKKIKIEVKE